MVPGIAGRAAWHYAIYIPGPSRPHPTHTCPTHRDFSNQELGRAIRFVEQVQTLIALWDGNPLARAPVHERTWRAPCNALVFDCVSDQPKSPEPISHFYYLRSGPSTDGAVCKFEPWHPITGTPNFAKGQVASNKATQAREEQLHAFTCVPKPGATLPA